MNKRLATLERNDSTLKKMQLSGATSWGMRDKKNLKEPWTTHGAKHKLQQSGQANGLQQEHVNRQNEKEEVVIFWDKMVQWNL